MTKGYIYVAGYFHRDGEDIGTLTEKKIGRSIDVPQRESQLNNTKMTLGVTMHKCWEVENMEVHEKSLHAVLGNTRLSGEWFKDADESLIGRVSAYMDAQGFAEYQLAAPEDQEEKKAVERGTRALRAAGLRQKYPGVFKEGQAALTATFDTMRGARATVRLFPFANRCSVAIMDFSSVPTTKALTAFVESAEISKEVGTNGVCSYIRFDTEEEAVSAFKELVAFLKENEDF